MLNVSAGTLSMVAVRLVMQVGIAGGLRPEVLLAAGGITEEDLRDSDARVPIATTIAMWEAIARWVSDPAFGVRAGRALRVRQLGLLGYLASFSATLRDALRRWERYGRIFADVMHVHLGEAGVHPNRSVVEVIVSGALALSTPHERLPDAHRVMTASMGFTA